MNKATKGILILTLGVLLNSCTQSSLKTKAKEASQDVCNCLDKNHGNSMGLAKCQEDWDKKYDDYVKALSEKDREEFQNILRENAKECVESAKKSVQ